MNKEEKVLKHAKSVWRIYFDDVDEDCNSTRGENSQTDFLAGYNQAVEDSFAPELLAFLKKYYQFLNLKDQKEAKELIQKATE